MRSLRPEYDPDLHGGYVDLLVSEVLSGDSPNIAVAGSFGTGKSSVLAGLRSDRRLKKIRTLGVSLAAVGESGERLRDTTGEKTLSAALQKEIVKQILYSANPNELPRSRFARIGQPRILPALALGALIGATAVGVLYAVGQEGPIATLAERLDADAWLGWLGDYLLVAGLALGFARLASSMRLQEVSIGPAKLSLDTQRGNYFDAYLDEIVHFVSRSKTRLIVFEDLDRFEGSGIFQALRELNTLLNSAPRRGRRVVFVYAVRDTIFERATSDPSESQAVENAENGVDAALIRSGSLSAASDRAKFFELVVPLVPFISHEVASDLMWEALSDLPDSWRPSLDVVRLVGPHFTDMRVIKSIYNEYVVFMRELLLPSQIGGLRRDSLFAVICYKHLNLADFEAIRSGTSTLDNLVRRLDELVRDRSAALDRQIAGLRNALLEQRPEEHAAAAGTRLNRSLEPFAVAQSATVRSLAIRGSGATYSLAHLSELAFWQALSESEPATLVATLTSGVALEFAGDRLKDLLGSDHEVSAWQAIDMEILSRDLNAALASKHLLLTSSLAQRVSSGELVGPATDGNLIDLRVVSADIAGTGMLLDLLASGYIDHNFALYSTAYYGTFLSANARTFMLRCIDGERSEPLYALAADEVAALRQRTQDEFLHRIGALNHSVFNVVLGTSASAPAVAQVAALPQGAAQDFVTSYLTQGTEPLQLVEALAPRWPALLETLSTTAQIADALRRDCLAIAFTRLSGDMEYVLSEEAATIVARELPVSPALTEPLTDDAAAALGDLLVRVGARAADLGRLTRRVRDQIISRGAFEITRSNLAAITDDPKRLGLDSICAKSPEAFAEVTRDLPRYIHQLTTDGPPAESIDGSADFATVMSRLPETNDEVLSQLLEAAHADALVPDISGLSRNVITALARTRRFVLTSSNVIAYVDAMGGVDDLLAACLVEAGSFVVDESTEPTGSRHAAAIAVLGATSLDGASKIALVDSLGLESVLPAPEIGAAEPEVLDWLFEKQLVTQGLTAISALTKVPWATKVASTRAFFGLAEQISALNLSDSQLLDLALASSVAGDVRVAALAEFDQLGSNVSSSVATRYMDHASQAREALPEARLKALVDAGASAKSTIKYVGADSSNVSDTALVEVIGELPTPWSALIVKGRETRVVPDGEGLQAVLRRLRRLGLVGPAAEKRTKGGQVRISMRHK